MRKVKKYFLALAGEGLVTLAIGFIAGLRYSSHETVNASMSSNKYLELFKIAIKWIKEPEQMEKFIDKNKDKTVGIYGMSYLGDCLQKAFGKKGANKIYGIDRNAAGIYNPDIMIYTMENELPHTDIIVVTAVASYEQIEHDLKTKIGTNVDIISLEDIFYM